MPGFTERGGSVNVAQRKIIQLLVDVLCYEISHVNDGFLISEEADRAIARYPVLARAVILGVGGLLTLHLSNALPARWDPVAHAFWRQFRG